MVKIDPSGSQKETNPVVSSGSLSIVGCSGGTPSLTWINPTPSGLKETAVNCLAVAPVTLLPTPNCPQETA